MRSKTMLMPTMPPASDRAMAVPCHAMPLPHSRATRSHQTVLSDQSVTLMGGNARPGLTDYVMITTS